MYNTIEIAYLLIIQIGPIRKSRVNTAVSLANTGKAGQIQKFQDSCLYVAPLQNLKAKKYFIIHKTFSKSVLFYFY